MYWKSEGPSLTRDTVDLALERAKSRGIKDIVVASCTGRTAMLVAERVPNVVCVTHVQGFADPGQNEMAEDTRTKLTNLGVKVLTATHVLSGAERGLSRKFSGVYPIEIMAHTLRMFGQGVKVGVEIAVMALDAGLISHGREVIAIAGSAEGADTAIIIRPAHASNILDTYISEIICKP